ncbi:MAG: GNAT family N-acetyltransferase [Parvibaculum sp.]|uniref:GNAT family N-acetyltransferase n=1 Tax=Parvibaculum sp. TaxID=2024848 RepID=UPI003C75437E
MTITLSAAQVQDKPLLRALLADYLTELATYDEVDFAYPYFDAYWKEEGQRWPWFIYDDGALMGFALVNRLSRSGQKVDYAMAEFYVLPQARGHGRGVAAALAVFAVHPGQWELTVFPHNTPAQKFWPKVMLAARVRSMEKFDHHRETVFRFRIIR